MSLADDIRALTEGTPERAAFLAQRDEEQEMMDRIHFHLLKAKSKHPDFPDKMHRVPASDMAGCLGFYRKVNNIGLETVDSVLQEEILEAYDACSRGDYEAAIDEAYDAVAVLLRWIEQLKKKGGKHE